MTAPRAYDGFGTITAKEFGAPIIVDNIVTKGDARLVLIERDHLQWQVGRYQSGLYAGIVDDIENTFEQRDITEALYSKLRSN